MRVSTLPKYPSIGEEPEVGLSEHKVEVVIAVSDLDQARSFYEDQLGLRPGPRQDVKDQGVRYLCAAGTGVFVYLSPDTAGKSSATLAGWFVDDLDETVIGDARGVVGLLRPVAPQVLEGTATEDKRVGLTGLAVQLFE
jgi:catechol 2,3-dioxygenase-like lactoylglutathione lyase family enzyme